MLQATGSAVDAVDSAGLSWKICRHADAAKAIGLSEAVAKERIRLARLVLKAA
jgi:hypothetical protein